ncbi:hypothetical protein H7I41_11200 [Mycobacterium manitobense]|uniref:Uncharacterized protein n=1 Tax=[Mycobacterium] manitobense TaxID=190147 RepID=A0A9X2YNJ7_9MYCO|nr:hypothetical protein [[Mycobacterium] manitobense]MCV7170481.1 hypothetical protein [[Mycobacterium] manitobense]
MNPWQHQQPYVAPPGYPPFAPPVDPRPSGATAITAGILGFVSGALPLIGMLLAVAGVGLLTVLFGGSEAKGEAVAFMSLLALGVLVPLVGSVALMIASAVLLMRVGAARYVVAVVCAALVAYSVVELATGPSAPRIDTSDATWSVLHVVTAVLALLPSTGRWCAARRRR